ncbi:chemotaxis response regulator protein-glutamate methylesterase [Erythrobacter sp. YT30]|nr:chemotaxis response regulator protein-glutamate methylesterase [Erythrobacter sp. YT30]
MIVDDSLTVRTIFKRMVESAPNLIVAETASSAEQAISKLRNTEKTGRVDVILLDLEMPGMGGLEALPTILETAQTAQVLVVSSLTEDGAEATLKALSMGAADTMLKPRPGGFNEDYRSQLLAKIGALGHEEIASEGELPKSAANTPPDTRYVPSPGFSPEVLAIGASTGGIHALNIMLRALPVGVGLPILITQHLPSSFISVFARQVEVISGRRTVIAEDGTPIRPDEVAVATGHGHMVVKREHGNLICGVSREPVRSGCLPSVDPMLSSLASVCSGNALAIILSGMGRDGSEGAKELIEAGGMVFAQDAETSAVWGMPGAVTKAGISSFVAPPERLAQAITAQTNASSKR